jgi:hypothetical protein
VKENGRTKRYTLMTATRSVSDSRTERRLDCHFLHDIELALCHFLITFGADQLRAIYVLHSDLDYLEGEGEGGVLIDKKTRSQ